ncbi:MAG: response regulator [Syntrophaceae bacterium]|jgi:two-component system, chemotaxis family, chemotaxis protein CheY|nr:response regulator [Syntrophaceae bacterium]HOC59206.1 response regulator [Smithellaceae bacterium]HQM45258.1 response regulator [Smithellaceae bacterium]
MIKKILIVDDSPVSIKIMKSCIPKDKGYELFDAANGQIGVDLFKQIKPDMVFMDLTMPVMNGFEALQEIMSLDQRAIVVIATADVQIKAIARAHDLGAFSVLKKPPNKDNIAAVIAEVEETLARRG